MPGTKVLIFFLLYKDDMPQVYFEDNQSDQTSNGTLDSIECLEFNNFDKNICHCRVFTFFSDQPKLFKFSYINLFLKLARLFKNDHLNL
jgi:hypothetical protein